MESDSRLVGSGTVRAWGETGIDGSISRHLFFFPGPPRFCVAPLLKCVHGVSGEGSPSSPVMSAGLKLLGGNFCMAYAGLYTVIESLRGLPCFFASKKRASVASVVCCLPCG